MRCSKKITRWCKKTRKARLKIHRFGLKVLTVIASINIILLMLLVDNLTRDGWLLAAVVDIPSVIWIILILRANGWIYNTPEFKEREVKHHGVYYKKCNMYQLQTEEPMYGTVQKLCVYKLETKRR